MGTQILHAQIPAMVHHRSYSSDTRASSSISASTNLGIGADTNINTNASIIKSISHIQTHFMSFAGMNRQQQEYEYMAATAPRGSRGTETQGKRKHEDGLPQTHVDDVALNIDAWSAGDLFAISCGPHELGSIHPGQVVCQDADLAISNSNRSSVDGSDWKKRRTTAKEMSSTDVMPVAALSSGVALENHYAMSGDKAIAKELSDLTAAEREQILHDLHAVAPGIEVADTMVTRKLRQLQLRLEGIKDKKDYEKALFLNPTYVRSERFQLAFLRAERLDAARAANNIVSHFKLKRILFGVDSLSREIVWDDLSQEDKHAYHRHGYALLGCDVGGRRIIVGNVVGNTGPNRSMAADRAAWFSLMPSMLDDWSVQKHGAVLIDTCQDRFPSPEHEAMHAAQLSNTPSLFNAIPFRVAATHVFVHDERSQTDLLVRSAVSLLPQQIRLRLRLHHGSPSQCMDSLRCFGVTPAMLQVDEDLNSTGSTLNKMLEEQLQTAVAKQQRQSTMERKLFPRSIDIVCGRGFPYRTFSGNVQFLGFLQSYKQEYGTAGSQFAKTAITVEILQVVKAKGIRFLKRCVNGDSWEEVPDDSARIKIAMTFRNLSRRRTGSGSAI